MAARRRRWQTPKAGSPDSNRLPAACTWSVPAGRFDNQQRRGNDSMNRPTGADHDIRLRAQLYAILTLVIPLRVQHGPGARFPIVRTPKFTVKRSSPAIVLSDRSAVGVIERTVCRIRTASG